MKVEYEFTDFFLLLQRLCRTFGKFTEIEIRMYEDDLSLFLQEEGEGLFFGDGTPIEIDGFQVCGMVEKRAVDGVWDVHVVFAEDIGKYTTAGRLKFYEKLVEGYGMCITSVVQASRELYLEVMDRIVVEGHSYENVESLCRQHGFCFEEVCQRAVYSRESTVFTARQMLKELAVAGVEREVTNQKSSSLKEVSAFNGGDV